MCGPLTVRAVRDDENGSTRLSKALPKGAREIEHSPRARVQAVMDIPKRQQVAATLLRQGQATSEEVANAVVHAWARIDQALASIVGSAGIAALYLRSIHVTARTHPALQQALGPLQRTLDGERLRSVLREQAAASAATQGADLLLTFHEILSHMVGPSLTERLLRSFWADFQGYRPSEDLPP